MAAPYNPPNKNEDFVFHLTLEDFGNPGRWKSNPTIAAGDFKISKDGGAFANLATLPSVEPASSVGVRVALSNTEMNADDVLITWEDQSDPPEWCAGSLAIPTTTP